jgi:tripartite ATP-independent transporter DctM subunit
VAQADIAAIFKAALVPGFLLLGVLSLYAFIRALIDRQKGRAAPVQALSLEEIRAAFTAGVWDWPIVLILLVGVYGGFVTIAEVSALVLVYVIVVACLILKEVHLFRELPAIMVEAAVLSGAIIVILGVALGFTSYLVDEMIPNRILAFLTGVTNNPLVFLMALNIFLLAVGCLMDIFSAIVIIVPIITPIAISYGIDPIHLCVIFLVNLEIGYSTPPVGINLFIASLRFKRPVTLLYKASVPYLLLLLLVLLVVTYIPGLSGWLLD